MLVPGCEGYIPFSDDRHLLKSEEQILSFLTLYLSLQRKMLA